MKQLFLLTTAIILLTIQGFSQVYTNKLVGEKNLTLKENIEKQDYPYALPIWGKKAAAKGYQLPFSAGLGVNYLWQQSDIVISNLKVGFNGGEMISLDEVIRFDDATSTANAVNIRPDLWLFPFLNVYGILAFAKTSTAIDAGIWLPDLDSTWSQVSTLSTKADFNATTLGFGLTPTFGVGGIWIALDMNCAWSDVNALKKPVFTFVFGPRVGKTIKFKNPDMNIAFWAGAFRLKYSSATTGSLNLADLFPTSELQAKVDQGFIKVSETSEQVEAWWSGLTPAEQKNPVNKTKYEAANKALERVSGILNSANGALNDGQSSTVEYSLDKTVKDKWNFLLGTQFQINRHLMIRAEYGFLGSRQQFIGGLQYRFGL